jgi:hypothetical protein
MKTNDTTTKANNTNTNSVTLAANTLVLQPGTRIPLGTSGAFLSAEQLAKENVVIANVGGSLMVQLPDGARIALEDFYVTDALSDGQDSLETTSVAWRFEQSFEAVTVRHDNLLDPALMTTNAAVSATFTPREAQEPTAVVQTRDLAAAQLALFNAAGLRGEVMSDATPTTTPTSTSIPTLRITGVTDDVGSVTGTVASGGVTDDTNVLVSGTLGGVNSGASLASGETLGIYDGATFLGNAVVTTASGGQSTWNYADARTLSDTQQVRYTAQLVGTAGTVGTVSDVYTVTVDTAAPTAPTVTLGAGALGGVTAAEAAQAAGVVTVSAEDASSTVVTFSRASNTVSQTVTGTGSVQALTLNAAQLSALGDGFVSVSAVSTDVAGNVGAVSRSRFLLDTTPPVITIDTVAGNNVVNAAEKSAGVTVSGTTDAQTGQTVTVVWGGSTKTALVSSDGIWQVLFGAADMPSDASSSAVTASVSDSAGNPATIATIVVRLDTVVPVIAFDAPLTDGAGTALDADAILNINELNAVATGGTFAITGSTTAEVGQALNLTLNNQSYTATVATVAGINTWQVNVPKVDMEALVHGNDYAVVATVSDAAGNPATPMSTSLAVRLAPPDTPTIHAQYTHQTSPVIDGVVQKELPNNAGYVALASGDTIDVTVDGQTYTLTVGSSSSPAGLSYDSSTSVWSLSLPTALAQSIYDVGVDVRAVGYANPKVDISSNELLIKTAAPTLSVNTVAGDNVVNIVEGQAALAISGTVTDYLPGTTTNAAVGQALSLTLAGNTYNNIVVQADGSWSTLIPVAHVNNLSAASYVATISLTSIFGNTASQTHTFAVDLVKPDTPDATLVASVGVVNGTPTINNGALTAPSNTEAQAVLQYRVTKDGGLASAWASSYAAPAVDGTADGLYTVDVRQTDAAGNLSNTQSLSFILNTTAPAAPVLTLGVGVSGGATSTEATQATGVVTVSAQSGASTVVTFTNGSSTVTKTVTATGSAQAVGLSAADLTILGDGTIAVSAVATDAAGNASSAGTSSFSLDTVAPSVSAMAISGVDGSDVAKASTLVAGDKVNVLLTMSEATTVTGTPTYTVDVGGVSKTATYVSGSGSTGLVFQYTVTAGDTDAAGGVTAAANALRLAGGTLADAAGNAAVLAVPAAVAGLNSMSVDALSPTAPPSYLSLLDASQPASTGGRLVLSDSLLFQVVTPSLKFDVNNTNTFEVSYTQPDGRLLQFVFNDSTSYDNVGTINSAVQTAFANSDLTDLFVLAADGSSAARNIRFYLQAKDGVAIDAASLTIGGTMYLSNNFSTTLTASVASGGLLRAYQGVATNTLPDAVQDNRLTFEFTGGVDRNEVDTFAKLAASFRSATGATATDAALFGSNPTFHVTARAITSNGGAGRFLHLVTDPGDSNKVLQVIVLLASDSNKSLLLGGEFTFGTGAQAVTLKAPSSFVDLTEALSDNTPELLFSLANTGAGVGDEVVLYRDDAGVQTEVGRKVLDGTDVTTNQVTVQVTTALPVGPSTLSVTLFDSAGNQASRDAVVTLSIGGSSAPVVIDLNRDGELSYGQIHLDVNGDGVLDNTHWAGAQDGVLVWDKYHDGQVHDNSQYAFAQYDTESAANGTLATDLSGLAQAFDSNHDGVFDAGDVQFGEFKVWQDVNQNGVSDAGEVRSLADWGLSAINLTSDGVVRTPTDGVTEYGHTTATATDGSQVLVGDVAFRFDTLVVVDVRTDASSVADHAAHTLHVALNDVLGQPTQTLVIDGGAQDRVVLQGLGWVSTGETNATATHQYAVFTNGAASVLVEQHMATSMAVL